VSITIPTAIKFIIMKSIGARLVFIGEEINIIIVFVFCMFFDYNLLMNKRLKNKRTNLGKINLDKIYIITTSRTKAKVTWFIK